MVNMNEMQCYKYDCDEVDILLVIGVIVLFEFDYCVVEKLFMIFEKIVDEDFDVKYVFVRCVCEKLIVYVMIEEQIFYLVVYDVLFGGF